MRRLRSHVPGWRAGVLACLLCCAAAGRAGSQDFAGASPASAGGDDAFAALERALPPAAPSFTVAASHTRWWELRELETRSALIAAGWRGARAALGVAQTGVPELGWTAVALSAGGAGPDAGAALRVCGRLERDLPWRAARALSGDAGFEAGAGAWLVPAAGVCVWASAPQMLVRGLSPPLARALELGVRAGSATGVWVLLRAPSAGDDGERALGVAIDVAPLAAWAEVRDTPLRGAAGVRARAAALRVDVRIDAHPVLGETVRVAVGWQRDARGTR